MMNKLYSIIAIACLALPLAACATTGPTTIITKDIPVVIAPPDTLYSCPQVSTLPNPATLTNRDLANLITTLVKNNRVCGANMSSIQTYVAKARMQILANQKSGVKKK